MFPLEIPASRVEHARQVVLSSNVQLPLMGFGYNYNETDNYLYYRHVLMLPIAETTQDANLITQTAWLVYYLITGFYPTFVTAVKEN